MHALPLPIKAAMETDCLSMKRMISSEKGPCTNGRIESVKLYIASAVLPNWKISPYKLAIALGFT